MAQFNDIFKNFAILSLMMIGLLGFVVNVQQDNNAPDPIIDNLLFNNTLSKLVSNVTALESESSTQGDLFYGEKPVPGAGSILLFTIVSFGKTFSNVLFGLFVILLNLPIIVLGISPTVSSTLWSLLTVLTVTAIWGLYKWGG
ncbi:hypothetical protein LCGC14_1013590 [marine sediment metagenome]|uniref:Uncharacterized protein n=1 Tax=marine sediment metagenome TaxID=412755 RepID=A0A0F9R5K2_9ZZZZ